MTSQNWTSVMNDHGVGDTPNPVHNVGETGCVLNSRQNLKVIAGTGSRMVLKHVVTMVAVFWAGEELDRTGERSFSVRDVRGAGGICCVSSANSLSMYN
jgi:hypothetical protein